MAEVQSPQKKLDGAGAFHLNSHPGAGGAVNAGLPYKLYKDDALSEMSAGIGYHGYANPAGTFNKARATLEQSRVLSNPALRDGDEPSAA